MAGVCADTTAISTVNPGTRSLTYRGYPVQELARRCGFEALEPGTVSVLRNLPITAHPMDTLRTAVAMDHRRRRRLDPVAPRGDLGFAANFLYMTFGEVPPPEIVAAFETSLVLYAEDGCNASAFTARVVTSTRSDTYSAVTAAIGALKGPLHGGANEAVMGMMEQIGTPGRAREWLSRALADKQAISGFGHRAQLSGDPRVPVMRAALGQIAAIRDGQRLVDIYEMLARAMDEATGRPPTLDYPTGPAYHLMGFDAPAFTPILAAARLPGWTAHIAEQSAGNRPIRPLAAYDGPAERHLAA